jgi:DNA-binding transcriptional MerR regulator
MKIGELAKATATQIETIRYYEREGLLPEPGRSGGNYRVYDKTHAQRLSFIRRCRALDMNLDKIRVLLRSKDAPAENCAEVSVTPRQAYPYSQGETTQRAIPH